MTLPLFISPYVVVKNKHITFYTNSTLNTGKLLVFRSSVAACAATAATTTIATATACVTTTETATTWTTTFFFLFSFIHNNCPAFNLCVIQFFNCFFSFFFVRHFYKTKAFRSPSSSVCNDFYGCYFTVFFKNFL